MSMVRALELWYATVWEEHMNNNLKIESLDFHKSSLAVIAAWSIAHERMEFLIYLRADISYQTMQQAGGG